jgi:hypothetical protein
MSFGVNDCRYIGIEQISRKEAKDAKTDARKTNLPSSLLCGLSLRPLRLGAQALS